MSFIEIIASNREKFHKYNRLKFQRFQEFFPSKNIARVINSIPLFLSVNDKKVPGYVEGDVPMGIVNYVPDQESLKYLQTRFRIHDVKTGQSKPFIQMLAVMGSIGTIAYTKKSDFDYWVCVDRQGVPDDKFSLFRKKVDSLVKWICQETRVEVNLFINEIEKIKKNIFADSDVESLGSTIGALLKDEFYRSSIVIAGKTPFWWVIPRFINDSEYSRLYEGLPEELKEREYVDLGNLFEISKEDFLGAALFLIIKSLGNPFKSIIKIGVLEKYLFDTEYSPILCHKVKTNILHETLDNNIIDSYILMFDEVYDYYSSHRKDPVLLKVLQENLYLKIDPRLSKYTAIKDSKNIPYNVRVMFRYISDWKWSLERIRELDDFSNWDYNRIMTFWTEVKKFILMSYQNIARELPLLDLKEKLPESDFNMLSRKIQTNFAVKENKIDQYITFKDTPHEPILYIEPVSMGIHDLVWKLTKNIVNDRDEISQVVIKTGADLIKLLAWVTINGIYDPVFTRIKVQSGYQRINQNMVTDVLNRMAEIFNGSNLDVLNEYYLSPAFNLANMIIINFNRDSPDSIKSLCHIYYTSWGESFIDESSSGLRTIEVLQRVLEDGLRLKKGFGSFCGLAFNEPTRKYFRGIEKLFQNSYEFIVQGGGGHPLSMVSRFDNFYINILRDEKGRVSITPHKNMIQLLTSLSLAPRKRIEISFYGDDEQIKVMNYVMGRGKENHITIAYEEKGALLFLYLINERGNLFTFFKPLKVKEKALESLYCFCKNAISQVNAMRYLPDINGSVPVYRIVAGKDDETTSEYETPSFEKKYANLSKKRGCLEAAISRQMTEENHYSLSVDEKNPTEFVPFNRVGEKMMGFEGAGGNFIERIKFIEFRRDYFAGGTMVYFLEKYRLEILLDRANA